MIWIEIFMLPSMFMMDEVVLTDTIEKMEIDYIWNDYEYLYGDDYA